MVNKIKIKSKLKQAVLIQPAVLVIMLFKLKMSIKNRRCL